MKLSIPEQLSKLSKSMAESEYTIAEPKFQKKKFFCANPIKTPHGGHNKDGYLLCLTGSLIYGPIKQEHDEFGTKFVVGIAFPEEELECLDKSLKAMKRTLDASETCNTKIKIN